MALTPEERQAFLGALTDMEKARFDALPPQKQSWFNDLTSEQLAVFAQTPKTQEQLLNRLAGSASMGEFRESVEYATQVAPAREAEAQKQAELQAAAAKRSQALHAQGVAEQQVKNQEYVTGIINAPESQIGAVMSAAKTVNPQMVTSGSMWGYNYNTTQDDLVKIDQALADNPSARVAFHAMIGNGDQIRAEGTNGIVFPAAITQQNITKFNSVLEQANGTNNAFAKVSPMGQAQEEPTMQPASLTEPSLSDRVFKPLQKEHQENENRRIEQQIRKAGGGAAPQASMQGCDFNPADLNTLAPSCPKGPGGARELS